MLRAVTNDNNVRFRFAESADDDYDSYARAVLCERGEVLTFSLPVEVFLLTS